MTPMAATNCPIAESISQFIGGLRPNENKLSHRWRRRAWQTRKTVS
jgi:hypothetical protein